MSPIESACLMARLSTRKSIEVSFEFMVELRHSASFQCSLCRPHGQVL